MQMWAQGQAHCHIYHHPGHTITATTVIQGFLCPIIILSITSTFSVLQLNDINVQDLKVENLETSTSSELILNEFQTQMNLSIIYKFGDEKKGLVLWMCLIVGR